MKERWPPLNSSLLLAWLADHPERATQPFPGPLRRFIAEENLAALLALRRDPGCTREDRAQTDRLLAALGGAHAAARRLRRKWRREARGAH